jgi:phosphoenolpyruvate phosphomutase
MAAGVKPLLAGPTVALAAGAHDALSARLAEEAGFDAIWASGFGISAVQAVPDANILTLTETLDAVRRMADAVQIPVIADCDNGYGNAINVMRTVAEFERAGAAGICIEDNEFPKRCSFYAGVSRDLVAVEEHARKVEAAVAARRDPGFAVIARTEALICGLGEDEALVRARAYAAAGADAVLVHSKEATFDELRSFATRWDGRVPLVAVPTTYPAVTPAELWASGFRLAIFANQTLRGAIMAMREVLERLRAAERADAADDRIVPLEEVYRLVGVPELKANERRFLFAGAKPPRAIVLAAGFEPGLMPLIAERPKTMLEVRGRSILERQVDTLGGFGIRDVVVVRGYKKEQVAVPGVRFVDNDRFAETGELHSLFAAATHLDGPLVVLYGDIIFEPAIVERLLHNTADVAVVVDRSFPDALRAGDPLPAGPLDLVVTETPAEGRRFVPPTGGSRVRCIGPDRGARGRARRVHRAGRVLGSRRRQAPRGARGARRRARRGARAREPPPHPAGDDRPRRARRERRHPQGVARDRHLRGSPAGVGGGRALSAGGDSRRFVEALEAAGFDFVTGVPCSLVAGVIAELDARGRWFVETREDAALGVAAGAYLGGRLPVVVMQNSGLGVSLNALGSLHLLYDMPCLLVITWRGYEGKDAPEHLVMGEVMPGVLDLFGVPWRAPDDAATLPPRSRGRRRRRPRRAGRSRSS